MSLICCDCGSAIQRRGCRGRQPKRCKSCRAVSERKRLASRDRPQKGEGQHSHTCKHCKAVFLSCRRTQQYCSPHCSQRASRRRFVLVCQRKTCGKQFETTPRGIADGRRFCCRQCSYLEPLVCQNPKCGREFRMKHRTRNEWQNKGKYCCPKCYQDHRFGEHRPRRWRSRSQRRNASGHALATSLRKRCKQFDVTFDPACTRQAVLDRDGWKCQKCHIMCNKEYVLAAGTNTPDQRNAEHDHIIPLSAPGSPGNVFENSQCLCRKCNGKKRDKPDGQLRLCLEEEAWGVGVRVRSQRNSRSSEAIPATVL